MFIQLKPDEHVVLSLRSAIWPLWTQIALAALLIIAPFFFLVLLFSLRIWGPTAFTASLILGIFWALRLRHTWVNTIFIITSERVVDVDQRGFLNRVLTEVYFPDIIEVSASIRGFWPTIFRYGRLYVKTRGEIADLAVSGIKHPERVAAELNNLRQSL